MSIESTKPNFAPPAPTPTLPGPVRLTLGLVMVLACYAGVMGVMLLPVGLFVGPHGLAAAAIHGVLAAILFAARRGIMRRSRPARWLLIVTSAVGIVAIPSALILDGTVDPAGCAWFSGVAIYCAVMLGASTRPAVARWCSRSTTSNWE